MFQILQNYNKFINIGMILGIIGNSFWEHKKEEEDKLHIVSTRFDKSHQELKDEDTVAL